MTTQAQRDLRAAEDELAGYRHLKAALATFIHNPAYDRDARIACAQAVGFPEPGKEPTPCRSTASTASTTKPETNPPSPTARTARAARDEIPFSNSSEGYGWMANWCDRCIHDKDQRTDTPAGPGCPLVLVSLMGRRPVQWLDGPRDEHGRYSIADQYHCVEYRHEDHGPAEPQPIPDPPGQLTLAPRADYEGVRMLAQPAPALAVP